MATLADSLKPLAKAIRGIPGEMGLRTHRVWVVISRYTGAHAGEGDRTDEVFELTEGKGFSPKVRWLRSEEIAVGGLASGTIEVGPITADVIPSTVVRDALNSATANDGDVCYLKITGPNHPDGALYRVTDRAFERGIHYKIQAKPVEDLES